MIPGTRTTLRRNRRYCCWLAPAPIGTCCKTKYEKDQKHGLDYDIRKDIFKNVPNLKLSDIKTFEQNHFKNKKYTILVIGKKENLDMKIFEKQGKVTFLSLQDIFGY